MLYRLIILRQRLIMYKSIRLVINHLYKCRSWVLNKINSSYIQLKNWCWDPLLHGHNVTLEIYGRFVTHSKTTTWVTSYRPDNCFQIFRGEHVVKILPSPHHLEDHWPDSVTLIPSFHPWAGNVALMEFGVTIKGGACVYYEGSAYRKLIVSKTGFVFRYGLFQWKDKVLWA